MDIKKIDYFVMKQSKCRLGIRGTEDMCPVNF